jgi:hypothetical protein
MLSHSMLCVQMPTQGEQVRTIKSTCIADTVTLNFGVALNCPHCGVAVSLLVHQ